MSCFAITQDVGFVVAEPQFLVAVLVGLVLAMAFQMLLTTLSVATGFSAAGDLEDQLTDGTDRDRDDSDGGGWGSRVRSANRMFGVWSTATGCVALFAAAWLAGSLAGTPFALTGVALGLAVWALFYLVACYVEVRLASSVLGGFGSALLAVARGTGRGIGTVFGKSDRSRAQDVAADVAAAVRDEFLEEDRVDDLRREIRDYLHSVNDGTMARDRRRNMEKALSRVEFEAEVDRDGGEPRLVASLQSRSGPSRTTISKVESAASHVKRTLSDERDPTKRPSTSLVDSVLRLLGASPAEAEERRRAFVDALAGSGREELDPESILHEVDVLLDDPRAGMALLRDRAGRFDGDTLRAALSSHDRIDESHADSIVSTVEKVAHRVRERARSAQVAAREATSTEVPFGATEQRVEAGPLDLEGIKDDMRLLFDDPRAAAQALAARLKRIDDTELRRIAATAPGMDEERVDRVVEEIEKARQQVLAKAERMQAEIEARVESVREEAAHQAEEVRKTGATAAWWATIAASSTAVAAGLGGWVSTM